MLRWNAGMIWKLLIFSAAVLFSTPLFSQTTEQRRADSLLLAGIQQINNDNFKEAGVLLEEAKDMDPENDAVYYYLGYVACFSNDAVSAEENFRQAYIRDSSNVWYCRRLANLYERMNRMEDAERLYVSLQKKRSGDVEVLSSLYDVYLAERKFDLADSALTKLERISGSNDFIDLSRVDLEKSKGEYDKFFSALSKFFAKDGVPVSGKKEIFERLLKTSNKTFNYYHIKDYTNLLEVCLKTHPGDTVITHLAAEWYYSIDKPGEMEALVKANPGDLSLLSYLVSYHFGKGNYESSLFFIEKALEQIGDDKNQLKQALTLRGDCYYNMGRRRDAFKDYQRLLKMFPDDVYILNNYSYYLAVDGRNLSKAEKLSGKTIGAQPENSTFLDTYGWILYRQKKYAQAKTYLQKAIVYGGDSAEIYEHYAATLDALGEKTLAEVYRQKALAKKNGK